MFGVEIGIPLFVFLLFAVTLAAQLYLCFKVKSIIIKLIPVILFAVSTVVFSICSAVIGGWDGMGYLFFALLSFILLACCGIGWMIRGIIQMRRRKNE